MSRLLAALLAAAIVAVSCGAPEPTRRSIEPLPSETVRPSPSPSPTPAPTPTPDMTGWQVVREEAWGYAIGVPEDWLIVEHGAGPNRLEVLSAEHPTLVRLLERVIDDVGDLSVRFAALAPDGSTVVTWRLDEDGLAGTAGIDAYVASQAAEIGQTLEVSVNPDFHPRIRAQRIWDGAGEIDIVLIPRGADVWQLEVLVERDPEAVGEVLRAMLFRYVELPG